MEKEDGDEVQVKKMAKRALAARLSWLDEIVRIQGRLKGGIW